ncbi:hypothetical protein LG3211_4632 [Lysobacter gummosus]|nr:hypothetical protein LG3211_4632 [Lysobacter gummosus]
MILARRCCGVSAARDHVESIDLLRCRCTIRCSPAPAWTRLRPGQQRAESCHCSVAKYCALVVRLFVLVTEACCSFTCDTYKNFLRQNDHCGTSHGNGDGQPGCL